MSISNTIKSIQDVMRKDAGVDGDAQRISQLGWMLFLKVFDDYETEQELMTDDYESPIPEKYRYRNWALDEEGITGDALLEFIDGLFKELKEMELDERSPRLAFVVQSIFEDSYNYMKSGTLLRQVVNKLNEINFNKKDDRHQFNDIYEKILKDLQSAGNAGEYYTPRAVTKFMTQMVNPQIGETVFDPACGTGGFLVDAIEHMKEQSSSVEDLKAFQENIRGVEKKPMPHMLCTTNLILHGIDVPNVRRDNTLNKPYNEYKAKDRVDVVLTNPPFGGQEEDGIEKNFPAQFQTRETADLFLVLIMRLLKEGGRCALVLPDGFLFGEGVKTRIKERLLKENNLHTIVRLPKGVFAPYTSINTNLLFFEKGGSTDEVWYFEHTYPEGYKSYSKTKPIRIEEFDVEKEWWDDRTETDQAWKVTAAEIEKRNYNLDIKNPNSEENQTYDVEALLAKRNSLNEEIEKLSSSLLDELKETLA
ncbi:type I restriction-modification system subunit M [Gracilimonas amylolytica]|uniref:type I restriction-modification system subunit M n=1 Tax=Gracilimonas amylolytica TaxID=1749045 RepID=UPI000CD95E9C|nr:class I SAM-dependent DNA methyltransferase [Gracilimonas amylolytica]